jgi:hypothetical protein
MTPVAARRSQRYSLTVWKSTERIVPSAFARAYALTMGRSLSAARDDTTTSSPPSDPDPDPDSAGCTANRSRKGFSEWL